MVRQPGMTGRSGDRRARAGELWTLLRSALRSMWRASPRRSALVFALQILASLSIFVQILLIDRTLTVVLEVGTTGGSVRPALLPVSLLAVVTAATTIASTVANLQQRVLGELVSREIWRRLLDVSERVELRYYDDPDFYDQAQRVQVNAGQQTRIVVQSLLLVIGDTLGIIAATVAVLNFAPALVPLLLLSGVPLLLTSRVSGRYEFAFAVAQSPRQRLRAYLVGVLTRREEAKEVRAFSLAAVLRRRWEEVNGAYVEALKEHVRRRFRLALVGNTTAAVITAGTLVLALVLVDLGYLDIASAGAALVAVRLLGARVGGATTGVSSIMESSLFLRDLAAFTERSVQPASQQPARPAPANFERLTVSDVGFTYPRATRPALDGVSLEIKRGEVVALVGENGSGKTTLAKLLADLYAPDTGVIRWDDADLRELDPDSVRRRIAVVFQDFTRYKLSARDNIALGIPDADGDEEVVRRAARQADADDFLSALPAGYDTVLSTEYTGGTDLSLGQWQRVALARAFARDVPFVILDEPSASLDARAEDELFRRIRALFDGRSVLVVSHRFSTVRTADRIYMLSNGRIVEQGDHDSLMRQDGLYADLFALQARAFLDGRAAGAVDGPDPGAGYAR